MTRKLFSLLLALAIVAGTTTLVFAKTSGGSPDGQSAAVVQYGCPSGTSGTHCETTNPPPTTVTAQRPRIVLAAPRACVSKALRIRLHVANGATIKRVQVFLDGKRILNTKKTSFTLRIDVSKLRPGRHRLKTVAIDSSGHKLTKTRIVARCAQVKPRHQVSPRFTG